MFLKPLMIWSWHALRKSPVVLNFHIGFARKWICWKANGDLLTKKQSSPIISCLNEQVLWFNMTLCLCYSLNQWFILCLSYFIIKQIRNKTRHCMLSLKKSSTMKLSYWVIVYFLITACHKVFSSSSKYHSYLS